MTNQKAITEKENVVEEKVSSNATFTNSFEVDEKDEENPLTALGKSMFGDLFNKG